MSDSPISSVPDASVDEVSVRMASLERQVTILLIALILVTGTLAMFFFRQASNLRKDYDGLYPQAKQMVDTYSQNSGTIQRFVGQVVTYSQTHREVQPLLEHYGILAPQSAKH